MRARTTSASSSGPPNPGDLSLAGYRELRAALGGLLGIPGTPV